MRISTYLGQAQISIHSKGDRDDILRNSQLYTCTYIGTEIIVLGLISVPFPLVIASLHDLQARCRLVGDLGLKERS
ncbi:hypothetical protein TWF225_004690 [Orbilia oligospora]|nr:hypothetical protein TWF751_006986 [Orbilia oligospora]KAF3186644.1 hypothetical protein TWF225_004690 [Orbilia oligospora]KAF3246322.1 hypothetical protein TWF217_009993 [Orbilia oligospora]